MVQEGWAKPRYDGSGLELGLYLFHLEYPSASASAWKLVAKDAMASADAAGGSRSSGEAGFAHVRSGRARAGCWVFYVVSQKGAGPYDFFLTSERPEPSARELYSPSYAAG